MEQVQADLRRLAAFGEEVQRSLNEEQRAKNDIEHSISYFRQQLTLASEERDAASTRESRLQSEVSHLQQRIKELEAAVHTCEFDKASITAANRKVAAQLSGAFQFSQAVEQDLALRGLDLNATAAAA